MLYSNYLQLNFKKKWFAIYIIIWFGRMWSVDKDQEGIEDDEDFFMIKMDLINEDLKATYDNTKYTN